jgi:hypothetical protein
LINEKSPVIDSSNKYFLPLKFFTSLDSDVISASLESDLYLIGKPPFSITVPTPVGV